MNRYRRALSVFAVFVSSALLAQAQVTAKQVVPLSSGWEFRQQLPASATTQSQWRPAQVPGDVHLDLLRNKLIPEPFYRDDEAKLQWIEDAGWEYRCIVQATPALLHHTNVDLVFDGLDAYAQVFLNGKLVLTADNMFRQWRVDAKPYLNAGTNELLVVFPSPVKAGEQAASTDPWRAKTGTASKTYVRKAAYEWGWDWGPRFVTSGIWQPARLEAWNLARISDLHIAQPDISAAVAHIVADVEITASQAATASVSLQYGLGEKNSEASRTLDLLPGVNHVEFPIEIKDPSLWFPAGYGAQPIYTFQAQVKVGKVTEDEATARTGLRSVVLRRERDQWGRSFEFIVNGIPVYAKGADVIPFDSFPSRVTTADYRRILQSARDANMNMIRHWGGGYYETDEFYQLCDELGIMVWQDFMFGNDWQPGTYDFKQNVSAEAEYQLRRLRNHPSIILWCGNNETEQAFNWGPKLSGDVRLQMWQDYLTVFSGILASTVARLEPEVPYWPSSPSSDYEETSEKFQSGDIHDWKVWHGRAPFSEYEQRFPRFMTEYGFQSFPDMQMIETFTLPEDRTSIFTPVMLAHQKNAAGNAIIHDYLLRYYGEPKNFASFLYLSQVLQAEGIKVGAEHLRRIRPRNMGSIFWQLNDCWPVASWSSIDYNGHWKALQYFARRFYAPLLVSPHLEDGAFTVYVVSDKTAPTTATLRVRLLTIDGKVLSDRSSEIQVPALSSRIYLQSPLSELEKGIDAAQVFAVTDLVVGGNTVSSNLLYFVPVKNVALPKAAITTELAAAGDHYQLRLSSNVLAPDVYVSFGNYEAQLSDNYFNLIPGQPLVLTVKSAVPLPQLQSALKVVSLEDALAPAGSPPVANNP